MVRVQGDGMVPVDRVGQVWEFDYAMWYKNRRAVEKIVYIVLGSERHVDGDGTEMTKHRFFSVFDSQTHSWYERASAPFEADSARRRLA